MPIGLSWMATCIAAVRDPDSACHRASVSRGCLVVSGDHAEGLRGGCSRVPITDGKVPGHNDVVDIHASLAATGPRSNFVFNCQQGKGRTTIGMAMASLFLSAQVPPLLPQLQEVAAGCACSLHCRSTVQLRRRCGVSAASLASRRR